MDFYLLGPSEQQPICIAIFHFRFIIKENSERKIYSECVWWWTFDWGEKKTIGEKYISLKISFFFSSLFFFIAISVQATLNDWTFPGGAISFDAIYLSLIQMRCITCTAAALHPVTQVTLCMQRREQHRAECLVSQHCFQFRDNSRREGQAQPRVLQRCYIVRS